MVMSHHHGNVVTQEDKPSSKTQPCREWRAKEAERTPEGITVPLELANSRTTSLDTSF